MLTRYLRAFIITGLALTLSVTQSLALTGAEFTQKMNDDQRASYVDGSIEMLIFTRRDISKCILNWYYYTPGSAKELVDVIYANLDLPVSGIVVVLVKRHCGA